MIDDGRVRARPDTRLGAVGSWGVLTGQDLMFSTTAPLNVPFPFQRQSKSRRRPWMDRTALREGAPMFVRLRSAAPGGPTRNGASALEGTG
jgi:hypothetical protein